jgi:hypothetical protein
MTRTREQFKDAAAGSDTPSRAEQIRREMEEWRKKNEGRDLGREM